MAGNRTIALFLALCFSVFLGHNLVPHHHHAMEVSMALTGDCYPSHELDPDAGGHPLHCHAFNGIEFVKYSAFEQQGCISVIQLLMPSPQRIPSGPLAALKGQRSHGLKTPLHAFEYLGTLSLRAPPPAA